VTDEPEDSQFLERTIISPIESIDPITARVTPALLVIAGPQIGRSFPLEKEEFMIGRAEQSDLIVEDDLVSRHPCKLVNLKEGTLLVDLARTNGTLVNGHRTDRTPLKEGDQIQVGSSTILKFHHQEEVQRKFLAELYDAATKDFLTGVYNKKFFMDRLNAEFSFIQRTEGQLSIIVADLDHFKKVNDTYGHLAGDLALKKVAFHLVQNTRKHDMVARFGGEEFVIFMRECDNAQAKTLAEHLRQGVSMLPIEFNGNHFKVTISMGIATVDKSTRQQFKTFESVIDSADAKLYTAKMQGRNKVIA
jgi:diguanylate cyclase (GGDEF)-like protein